MSFSPRQSPFKRPESPAAAKTPSTVVAASPTMTMSSPTKGVASSSSPMMGTERQSPFVRRPSQLGVGERPKSPFARAPSRLSVAETPNTDLASDNDPFVVKSPPLSAHNMSRPTSSFSSRPTSSIDSIRSPPLPSQANNPPPPSLPRSQTSSTIATVRPAPQQQQQQQTYVAYSKPSLPSFASAGNYSHVPPALLRTMRESFEVLDTTSSNTITKSDLTAIMEQLGLDASPQSLSAFFPPAGPQTLNLSRFLDLLSESMKDLSEKDELAAAFGAFDVDDSGQIDLVELREAVLRTLPEHGSGARLSEREVDGILAEFTGRRAFGAKGISGKEVGGGGRGEVFRYKDFMASVSGSGQGTDGVAA